MIGNLQEVIMKIQLIAASAIAKMKTWLIAASAIGGIFASDIIRLSAVILKKNMEIDSMPEYIEREVVIEKNHGGMVYIDDIKNIPAADVAPVRHAMWEVVIGSDGKEHMVCTGCRKQQDLTGVFSYCPNCGAKMEGE